LHSTQEIQIGNVSTSDIIPGEDNDKKPHREKSVNDTRNKFRESFQRDLIAVPSLIPDLYLAFPRFISRPLKRNEGIQSREELEWGKGKGNKERQVEVEVGLTAMRI
jgi:hypothetical protein